MPTLIGIANLANQLHKIVSRKTQNFTVLVVGESGLGKTTLVNTLFPTLMDRKPVQLLDGEVKVDVTRAEIEENGVKVCLNVVETPGYADYVDNTDCWKPIISFVEQQYQRYIDHESRPERAGVDDLRVHVCLYFVEPTGRTLKPLDIHVMKLLGERVNLIPLVAKADMLTPADMVEFKQRIRDCIKDNGIQVYQPPSDEPEAKALMQSLPFSVIGSEETVSVNGKHVLGRQYLWGVAEVENENHCDFLKLRNLLVRSHMDDLIASAQGHYEAFRTQAMLAMGKSDDDPAVVARRQFEKKMKEDEENLRKRFTEQVRREEQRFRQWEQKLISERDRLNKDLETQHATLKALEAEIDELIKTKK